jgi:hypothetical protein
MDTIIFLAGNRRDASRGGHVCNPSALRTQADSLRREL